MAAKNSNMMTNAQLRKRRDDAISGYEIRTLDQARKLRAKIMYWFETGSIGSESAAVWTQLVDDAERLLEMEAQIKRDEAYAKPKKSS